MFISVHDIRKTIKQTYKDGHGHAKLDAPRVTQK